MLQFTDLCRLVAPPGRPRPSVAPSALAADTRGIAALELALTLPFMILLTMGIFDFGTFAYDKMEVNAAAFAGAEAAVAAVQSTGGTCSTGVITAAEQSATSLGKAIATSAGTSQAANCSYAGYVKTSGGVSTLSTTCPTSPCTTPLGTYAVAYAQTAYAPLLSWSGLVLPSTISATAMVRYQ
jgi:Flp pilus assembly protein TadG